MSGPFHGNSGHFFPSFLRRILCVNTYVGIPMLKSDSVPAREIAASRCLPVGIYSRSRKNAGKARIFIFEVELRRQCRGLEKAHCATEPYLDPTRSAPAFFSGSASLPDRRRRILICREFQGQFSGFERIWVLATANHW